MGSLYQDGDSAVIEDWCNDVILGGGGLHDLEEREMAVAKIDRDVAVAMWVVRALGNCGDDATATVVRAINERRAARGGVR